MGGLYPSFQTAEEFAAEWLGNLVPEADEDALAGGIDIAVGLINGGSSAADIIMVAQNFLATWPKTMLSLVPQLLTSTTRLKSLLTTQ